MKNIWKVMALLVISLVAAYTVQAQQKGDVTMHLNYNYSLPLGSFKSDIVSNGSPRGGTGDIMFSLNNKFSLGFASGYQDYYQKYPRSVYKLPDGEDISAVISNSIQTVPVMAKGMYNFTGGKFSFIQPYVSLGAGMNLVNFKQYLGEFGSSTNSVSFMAEAGAGVQIPFGRLSHSGLQLGATYDYIPYTKNGYNNLNSVNFQVGVHFPIR